MSSSTKPGVAWQRLPGSTPSSSLSILERSTFVLKGSSSLTSTQKEADQLSSRFVEEVTDVKTLAPMVAGGLVSRSLRIGVLNLGAEYFSESPLLTRAGASLVALAGESATFAGLNRAFDPNSATGARPGFEKEWAASAISLGTLQLFGRWGQGQNLIGQHLLSDAGLVFGHNLAASLHLGEKSEGNLATQLMRAEAMNWSLKGGLHLVHSFSPALSAMEKSLDLTLQQQEGRFSFLKPWEKNPLSVLAPMTSGGENIPIFSFGQEKDLNKPTIVFMSNEGGNNGNDSKDSKTTVYKPLPSPSQAMTLKRLPPMQHVPTMIGSVIDGRYRIDDVLGMGGMGVVYRGTHEVLGKPIAMKVLRRELSINPSYVERFLIEAKAATSIGNPHIVDISDFGKLPDGSTYFIMEYLNGVPLAHLVEGEKPVPVPRLIPIAQQLVEGLSAAHKAGIVHRDLKPDNIFLTNRGNETDFVKILDFGLAKMAGSGGSKLTMVGEVFGTPHYMSPEQAEGSSTLDHRTDIYAVGVILYEMASGKIPFNSENQKEILEMQIAKAPTPLHQLNPLPQVIPQGLEAIIMKCLSKKPQDRYQTMEELKVDLDKLSVGVTPLAVREMETRAVRAKWPLYAAVGAGIGTAGVLGTALFLLLKPDNKGPQPLPSGSSVAPQGTPDAPPPLKEVWLKIEPADAHVYLEGTDLGAGSVKVGVEKGAKVEVEIRREGYKTRKIIVDGSEEWLGIALEREPPAAPSTTQKKIPTPPSSYKPPVKPPPSSTVPGGVDNPWIRK